MGFNSIRAFILYMQLLIFSWKSTTVYGVHCCVLMQQRHISEKITGCFFLFIITSILVHIHVIQVCVRLQLAVNHKMFGANAGKAGACGHLEVA